jgi:hypothetical protein
MVIATPTITVDMSPLVHQWYLEQLNKWAARKSVRHGQAAYRKFIKDKMDIEPDPVIREVYSKLLKELGDYTTKSYPLLGPLSKDNEEEE